MAPFTGPYFMVQAPPSRNAAALAVLSTQASRAVVRRMLSVHGSALAALSCSHPLRCRGMVDDLQRQCAAAGVTLLSHDEAGFPERLKSIPDPPLLLYLRGAAEIFERPAIAIVGARRASRFGLELARRLAGELAQRGALIVSGLALGIDSAAHRGAIEQPSEQSGATVAVLGSGLERVQPLSNLPLANRVLSAGGALLSEYPLSCTALPRHFPERNRLISGLSVGVIVVEASSRSGSLITARFALEQGREVMAVPGAPGFANSAGCNRLLKQGAALVESTADVFDALGLIQSELPERFEDLHRPIVDEKTLRMLDLLGSLPRGLDEISRSLGLSGQACLVMLTELELDGFVARNGEGYIRRP